MTDQDQFCLGEVAVVGDLITDAVTGLPVTPGLATLLVLDPLGTLQTPALTYPAPNEPTGQFVVDKPGRWAYRFVVTGLGAGAAEGFLTGLPSPFVP